MKKLLHTVRWKWLLGFTLVAFFSCGTGVKKLIFAGEAEPADFSLSNTHPEVFAFDIPADAQGPFTFALELTYFDNQMQGWESLPLYYTLRHPDGREEDKRFSLKLKEEDGNWRGELKENLTDRIFEQSIHEDVTLVAGSYAVKLFGDNQDLSKPILGIVRVTWKVYANG